MNLVWSPEAIDDFIALRAYIAAEDPAAAQRVAKTIFRHIEELLSANSGIGRAGRVPGTRELIVPRTPFVIPYRRRGETIEILRIYHGARRWPDSF